jgi:hypothetical protein
MASNNDWLGGYTLQELLGSAPVTKSPKQIKKDEKATKKAAGKRGIIATVVGAPFRLIAGLIKLPIRVVTKLVNGAVSALTELVKLPFRLLGALASPWRNK